MRVIEFRSDTCTQPDDEMRRVMANAEVGVDSWGEDPTTNRLIEKACEVTGKEDALFGTSGTMNNLIASITYASQCAPGSEILTAEFTHTYWYEVGGVSRLAGLSVRPVPCDTDYLPLDRVKAAVRPKNGHMPQTAVLWLENTYMLQNGTAVPVSRMKELHDFAHENGIKVHLDGARIFNAAEALGTTVKEIASYADSVQFCTSKGLGAPFGSLLCGSKAFIDECKRVKTMVGGGMRQSGIMAAASLLGIERAKETIARDHKNAKRLTEGFNAIFPGCVDTSGIMTNLVIVDARKCGMTNEEMRDKLLEKGIKVLLVPTSAGLCCRFVLHNGVSEDDIEYTIEAMKSFC